MDNAISLSSLITTWRSNHSYIHGDKQFKCDYSECPKTFASTSALNNHKKVHSRVKAYVCKHYSESFNLKSDLKKHSLTHLYCNLCPKTFSSIQTLLKHKKIHSGVMDYVCEQCNKSFIQKGDLKKHLRIHTGEKQYKCSHWQCNYSSHFPENLKRHTLKHTGEKPHRCNACDYLWNRTKDSTLEKNFASAQFAILPAAQPVIWKGTWCLGIPKKNHISVTSAAMFAFPPVNWKCIRGHTLGRSHSSATNVPTCQPV